MKKLVFLLFILLISCDKKYPTIFSDSSLKEMVITPKGEKLSFGEILYANKGKKILINFWASWCKDCIYDFPKLKEFQEKFPDVVYVYLSVDFGKPSWKETIEKYNLKGEHYNLPKGMNNGDLVNFINLKEISRYMIINEYGEIEVFKANKASDKDLINALR